MRKIAVSDLTTAAIMQGPLRKSVMVVAGGQVAIDRAAAEIARLAGASVAEYVSAASAMSIERTVWSLLSATDDTSEFDPAEFGRAAERIARETVTKYVTEIEAKQARDRGGVQ